LEALQAAAGRLEGGKVFDSTTPADAGTNFQDSFKNGTRPPKSETLEPDDVSGVSATEERELELWLAVRDDFRTWVIENAA